MENFDRFKFDRGSLSRPRKPGISAYMRIKNEEQFVRTAILSHIDFYDEIIAVYNDCTDNTEGILTELAQQYPRKLKVHHYPPKVHWAHSAEYAQVAGDSVHGAANYSNYALSKTTRTVATKLDADHLAIPGKLASLTEVIRRDIAAGKRKLYYFSGINLARNSDGKIGVAGHVPFVGNRDHYYHPVGEGFHYKNNKLAEYLAIEDTTLETEYMGIMCFHLKYLKHDSAFGKYRSEAERVYMQNKLGEFEWVDFAEFRSAQYRAKMKKRMDFYDRLHVDLYAGEFFRKAKYKLTGTPPKLAHVRLARLAEDLAGIDWRRDAIDKLQRRAI